MKDIVDIESGKFHLGSQEYISPKTTFDTIPKLKETADEFFENLEMGIQNFTFHKREIDGVFYQISIHFDYRKISMIFVDFENGEQFLETELWNHLKLLKTNKYSKKENLSKAKNYHWGRISAFYAPKVNLGHFHITYK